MFIIQTADVVHEGTATSISNGSVIANLETKVSQML